MSDLPRWIIPIILLLVHVNRLSNGVNSQLFLFFKGVCYPDREFC